MVAIACLRCPSDECRTKMQPIPLPISTLQHKPLNPEAWPNDTDWLYVACPDCKQVSAYLRFDLWNFQDVLQRPHADKDWIRISFRCEAEGCGIPIQFHVLAEPTVTQTTETELREKLSSGHWKGVSQCGHPIAIRQDQRVIFERVRGRMQGYSLADPLWRKI